MNVMLIFSCLSAMFALISAIVLYASLDTPHAKVAMLLAGAFCSVIAAHQTASFVLAIQFRQRLKRGRGDNKKAIRAEAEGTVPSLAGAPASTFINLPGVTENTTELLEAVPRKRKPGNSQ